MFHTIVEGVELRITMEEHIKGNIEKNDGNFEKIYELILNIAPQIMDLKDDTELCIMDEELGISLILVVQRPSEIHIVVHVMSLIEMDHILVKKGLRVKKVQTVLDELTS